MSKSKKNKQQLREATAIFTAYLEKNRQRKTPERFGVLEQIYTRNDHFDAETLYIYQKQQ